MLWANFVQMLGQSRRRWTNINTTLAECLMLVSCYQTNCDAKLSGIPPTPIPNRYEKLTYVGLMLIQRPDYDQHLISVLYINLQKIKE